VNIVFFDEFGYSFLEELAPTWAPKGQRPILRRVTKERRAVSTAVGLTLSGKIYQRHFVGSMKSPQVVQALAHIHRHLPEGFILVWDGGKIHKSAETQTYLAEHPKIVVERLPPYAPELNPEEYCHGNVKARLKNATPANAQEICHLLDRGFARLRHRHDLLLGFFHEAGLSVKQLWLT
jgi:transposase